MALFFPPASFEPRLLHTAGSFRGLSTQGLGIPGVDGAWSCTELIFHP